MFFNFFATGRSNEEENSDSSVENRSRSRYPAESTGGKTRPSHSPLVMDTWGLDSKAERIARYKAERRRQLAEKYGLSIDSDVDSEYSSKYTRTRKDQDVSEKKASKSEKQEAESKDYSSVYSVRSENEEVGLTAPPEQKEYLEHSRESSPEWEKLKEGNERKAPEACSSRHDLSSALETSTPLSFPGHDSCQNEVPSSPKQVRRVSLSSPKQLASPSHSLSDTRLG